MKDHRNTAKADRIDALVPVLGTLFAGLAFVVTAVAAQPGMLSWSPDSFRSRRGAGKRPGAAHGNLDRIAPLRQGPPNLGIRQPP